MDGGIDGGMGGCVDRWMDKGIDGGMGGWRDEWMDRYVDGWVAAVFEGVHSAPCVHILAGCRDVTPVHPVCACSS